VEARHKQLPDVDDKVKEEILKVLGEKSGEGDDDVEVVGDVKPQVLPEWLQNMIAEKPQPSRCVYMRLLAGLSLLAVSSQLVGGGCCEEVIAARPKGLVVTPAVARVLVTEVAVRKMMTAMWAVKKRVLRRQPARRALASKCTSRATCII
jgi:hypothetical protein